MKSRITKWVVSLLVILVIIIVAVSVTKSLTYKALPGTIKIGVIAPLTGQYGAIGESFKNAVVLAINNDPRISVVFEDDKFDGKLGLSAYQKLTSIDRVDLIINESSPTLEAITPLVAQTHMPVFQVFEAKEHAKDSIFQLLPFSYPLATDLAKLAESRYKRIALVYSAATDVLVMNAEYFKKGISDPSIIVNETKITNTTDFRSEVTKILASNPDAVTNIFVQNDGIKFIKEVNAQKGNRKVAIICDVNTEFAIGEYIKALGTSTFEGCLSTNLPNLMSDSFKSAYKVKFNADPVIGSDWGYDAVTIVKDLLNVPKDQWLEKIQVESFDGASGHVYFDENGTRNTVSERHIFKDGKFVKLEE